MVNKKGGTLITDETIRNIILIISFVIIIVLIGGVAVWYYFIRQQTCHESIVMRSSVNFGPIQTSRIVPLNCQTENICLTTSGEDCKIFGKPGKDNSVLKKTIKNKEEAINEISEAMRDCHSTLGEGKLLFMPNKFFKYNYCLICSRIAFDDKSRKELGDITYTEIYQYLAKKRTRSNKNYLSYLYPGWTNWRNSENLFKLLQENSNDENFQNLKFEDWKMKVDYEGGFAIIAQMSPHEYWKSAGVTALAVVVAGVGAGLTATGIGAPIGVTLIAVSASAGAAGGAIFWYSSPTGEFDYSPPQVFPYELETLKNMGCSSFEMAP